MIRVIFTWDPRWLGSGKFPIHPCRRPPRSEVLLHSLEQSTAHRRAVDDDDARVGDGVPPPIFLEVVANEGPARDEDITVDDRASNSCVPADTYAGHQDAVLDLAEAVDANVRTQNAAGDRAAGNDAAWRDDRVEGLAASPPGFGEDELAGGACG